MVTQDEEGEGNQTETMNREQLSPVNDDNNYNMESSSAVPQDLVEDEEYINRLLLVRDARSSSDEQFDDGCGGVLPLHQMKSMKLSDDNSSSKSSENQKKMPPVPPSDTQGYDHEKSARWLGRLDGMDSRRPQWSDYAERYPSPPLDIDRHHHHARRDRGGGPAGGSRTDLETLPYYEERRWLERPSGSYRTSNNNDDPYTGWDDRREYRPQDRSSRTQHRQQQEPVHRSWDNSHYNEYDESSPYGRGDFMYTNDYDDSSPESGGNRHRPPQDMSAYYPIDQARWMGTSPRPNHKVGTSSGTTRTKSKSTAAKISTDKWFDKNNKEDEKFRYVDDIPRTVVKKKSRSVSSPLQQEPPRRRSSPLGDYNDMMMKPQERGGGGEYFEPILHRGGSGGEVGGDVSSSYNDSTTSFPEIVTVNDDHHRNDNKPKPRTRYDSKQQQQQRPTWSTSPSPKKKPPPPPSQYVLLLK